MSARELLDEESGRASPGHPRPSSRALHGPRRRLAWACPGGWTLVAGQEFRAGLGALWDVRLEREGVRFVPLGPNLHAEPLPEAARLRALLDWDGSGEAPWRRPDWPEQRARLEAALRARAA